MSNLTKKQKKAVFHSKGAACVIAGAGTGKTTTLTERIFFLVEDKKINPSNIIVTTFTRKATAKLYDRTYQRLGEKALQLRISTIDALICDLAQEAMHQDLLQSARLIGEANQRVLLFQSAWEVFGHENKNECPRYVWSEKADKAGLVRLLEQSIRAEIASREERKEINKRIKLEIEELNRRFFVINSPYSQIPQIYHGFNFKIPKPQDLKLTAKRYFKRLNELSATDYDLLSRDVLNCLKRNKHLARQFATQADFILVDEFQDTSRIQAEILLLLSGKKQNIWVVGDPCQQIYGWRGAWEKNLHWFIKKTKAKKYYLTDNWRSTQAILDCAYHFLSKRVPSLKRSGMLKILTSKRDQEPSEKQNHPVYTATLDRALFHVKRCLESNHDLNLSDVAILSSKLDKGTIREIRRKVDAIRLEVQFHSSRADRAMEKTISCNSSPPSWKPGKVLDNLYKHRNIQSLVSRSLRESDFGDLRTIRPLAMAAEALDSTLPPQALSFREAWPALKKTQDREVSVSSAIVNRPNAIQVMTIHAAKGLEFPIVLLMKIGKGGPRSFPDPKQKEECRLTYVGATRAKDCLILVHTNNKPNETLGAFGKNLLPIRRDRKLTEGQKITASEIFTSPSIIAATHLDLYEQCPLKFAAYHEGRLLPKWSIPQSIGSRVHKALEYYLRSKMPSDKETIKVCFERGFQDGDSPIRKLPNECVTKMRQSFEKTIKTISKTAYKTLAIEQRYKYLQSGAGQIDGVIDAIIEQRDGLTVLKEWKASGEISPDKRRAYTLQASAGALGIAAQNSHPIQLIEIVLLSAPSKTIKLPVNGTFVEETNKKLEQVFRTLKDRKYKPRRGIHCKLCQLKPQCPAWQKRK